MGVSRVFFFLIVLVERCFPNKSFAAKVLAVTKSESKYRFTTASGQMTVADPVFGLCSSVLNGSLTTERIGNWIQPTNLYGHVTVTGSAEATEATFAIRLCLLQWHESDEKNQFDGLRLLEDPTEPGGPWKVSEKGVFSILWDSYIVVQNNPQNAKFSQTVEVQVKMRKRPRCLYDGQALKKDQIFYCFMSDAAGLDNFPSVAAGLQLRYTDT